MDRSSIRKRLITLQGKNGKPLFGSDTIDRLFRLPEQSLSDYLSYLDYVESNGNIYTIPTYRSKQLNFLEYVSDKGYELRTITQNVVDEYFEKYDYEENNERVNYLKPFLAFFSLGNIDIEKFRRKSNKKKVAKMKRLSAENISEARYKFRNDAKKLFVFEMIYYTEFSMTEIGEIQREHIDYSSRSISYCGKESVLPEKLMAFIQKNESILFDESFDMTTTIEKIREDLAEYGMDNLTATDGKETRKALFWTCPQCGKQFEAVAENWCVKQYTQDGENWIVCREYCGHE